MEKHPLPQNLTIFIARDGLMIDRSCAHCPQSSSYSGEDDVILMATGVQCLKIDTRSELASSSSSNMYSYQRHGTQCTHSSEPQDNISYCQGFVAHFIAAPAVMSLA